MPSLSSTEALAVPAADPYAAQAMGEVASNPSLVVTWMGFTGSGAGVGEGLGRGPLCGPPGVGVGGGGGGGAT